MTQRIIGTSWYVDISHRTRRYRIRSPENSKKGAQSYEATLRKRLAEGRPIDDKPEQTAKHQSFRKFAWFWFQTHVRVHNKPSMVAKVKGTLTTKLIPQFGRTPIDKITTLQVEKYKSMQAKKGLANKTINNELSILRKCLRDAKRWHDLDSMPEITMLKLPPTHYKFLREEECSRLLAGLSGTWFEIVYVGLKTGLRRGELQGLRWQDIDFDNQTLTVRYGWCSVKQALLSPKGNRSRTIPLTNDVITMLSQRKQSTGFVFAVDGKVFEPKALGARLAIASKRAGLDKVTLHVLRHSYASQLAMKGVSIAVIQRLLGHTDIKVTMRYAHLSQDSLNKAIQHIQAPYVEQLAAK